MHVRVRALKTQTMPGISCSDRGDRLVPAHARGILFRMRLCPRPSPSEPWARIQVAIGTCEGGENGPLPARWSCTAFHEARAFRRGRPSKWERRSVPIARVPPVLPMTIPSHPPSPFTLRHNTISGVPCEDLESSHIAQQKKGPRMQRRKCFQYHPSAHLEHAK